MIDKELWIYKYSGFVILLLVIMNQKLTFLQLEIPQYIAVEKVTSGSFLLM